MRDNDIHTEIEPSETLLQQYETVRQAGYCNMFNIRCVGDVARQLGFHELAEAAESREQYVAILELYQDGRPDDGSTG